MKGIRYFKEVLAMVLCANISYIFWTGLIVVFHSLPPFFIVILTAVRLWILYCQFMMDIMEGEDGLQGVRSTFEKAIIAAGLHVTEVVWLIQQCICVYLLTL